MELFDIISKKDIVNSDKITGSIKTSGVCCDTRKLKTGEVFFAIPGEKDDGRGYIAEAYAKGAAAIVTENNIESRLKIPTIKVRNIRESFCRASFAVLENPQKKIKVIGITGTNGKTTIANLLRKVISDAGKKCAMFSTVEYDVCGAVYPSLHTTPPPETLAPLFAEAAKNGAEYAVMEVSSHAIAQKRVAAIDFDIGIFTNITRDHIDYHKTIEEYTRIKASLFSSCKNSIINADDKRAKEIASCAEKNIYLVSEKDSGADFFIKNPESSIHGVKYTLVFGGKEVSFSVPVTGDFNIYNTAECAAAAYLIGIDERSIIASLSSFTGVDGRMERIYEDKLPYSIIIDYAHTPDALEKALTACRKITKGRLICVFGCGGNRDKGKRAEMGEIATRISDLAVITSDNPRKEDPDEIIKEIIRGVKDGRKNYIPITSREEAIKYAMSIANDGDVILLAGKGHETYIDDINGKHHFSEKEVVGKIIEGNRS